VTPLAQGDDPTFTFKPTAAPSPLLTEFEAAYVSFEVTTTACWPPNATPESVGAEFFACVTSRAWTYAPGQLARQASITTMFKSAQGMEASWLDDKLKREGPVRITLQLPAVRPALDAMKALMMAPIRVISTGTNGYTVTGTCQFYGRSPVAAAALAKWQPLSLLGSIGLSDELLKFALQQWGAAAGLFTAVEEVVPSGFHSVCASDGTLVPSTARLAIVTGFKPAILRGKTKFTLTLDPADLLGSKAPPGGELLRYTVHTRVKPPPQMKRPAPAPAPAPPAPATSHSANKRPKP
jgi:hypothetical protein